MITSEIRVAFGDTDPYGVIYFASYFRYFHRGIEDFFLSRNIQPVEIFKNKELNFGLPIVQTSCRYLSPARYGDILTMETHLKSVNKKKIIFTFVLRVKARKRVVAEGEVSMVGINSHWKSAPLPESILSKLLNEE